MTDRPVAYLIDSDWVIDTLLGTSQARALLTRLRPEGVAISAITYMEIREGIIGGRDREQAERTFRAFLHGTPILPVGEAVAERAAEIRAALRQRKQPMVNRALDLLIAATALEHDLTLVSRNTRDYGDIPGLRRYQPA